MVGDFNYVLVFSNKTVFEINKLIELLYLNILLDFVQQILNYI